jgi:phage-related minor tail protein
MTGPRFDFTINLGHVISVGSVIVVMIGGWVAFDYRLKAVESTLANFTQTLIEQVKQGRDLAAIENRVSRLERITEARP